MWAVGPEVGFLLVGWVPGAAYPVQKPKSGHFSFMGSAEIILLLVRSCKEFIH